jgi:hypothetical protein
MTNTNTTVRTRTQYLALFPSTQAAMAHEEACLSIASEFRPACADLVLTGAEPTPGYWAWLASQIEAE